MLNTSKKRQEEIAHEMIMRAIDEGQWWDSQRGTIKINGGGKPPHKGEITDDKFRCYREFYQP